MQKNDVPDSDYYLKTLKACEINETDYFSRLVSEDITEIAKGIKESHRRDTETGDANNPLTDVINIVNEYKNASDPMKATLTTLSKQLGMNFNKMEASEVLFFKTIVEKYSTVYRNMLPKKGRGKNSGRKSASLICMQMFSRLGAVPNKHSEANMYMFALLAN